MEVSDIEVRLFGRDFPELSRELCASRRLGPVWDLISREYADATLTLSLVARRCGISRSQLNQRLREKVGIPFHGLLTRFRRFQAAGMLSDPESSITEVAESTGFEDAQNLRRHFLKYLGQTPREFRARERPD